MRPLAAATRQSPGSPVSVVVARFDDLLARGVHALLATDPSLAIVAQDIEQRRISVVLRAHRPDVAILDANALDKLADVRELVVAHPATRLVLFVGELSSAECAQLLAFGASACLARDTQARDVLNAVHLASRGFKLVPRFAGSHGGVALDGQLLTRREGEVLPLLARGRTNPQIALELEVGVETVRTHARNIYRKLGVSSRNELTAPSVDERAPPPASQIGPARRAAARPPRTRRGHGARRT
jgi:DNA-binding NarL/FixJ family response regulator